MHPAQLLSCQNASRTPLALQAVSVATLSGLLWTPKPPNVQREISRVRTIPIPVGADEKIWAAHVAVAEERSSQHAFLMASCS